MHTSTAQLVGAGPVHRGHRGSGDLHAGSQPNMGCQPNVQAAGGPRTIGHRLERESFGPVPGRTSIYRCFVVVTDARGTWTGTRSSVVSASPQPGTGHVGRRDRRSQRMHRIGRHCPRFAMSTSSSAASTAMNADTNPWVHTNTSPCVRNRRDGRYAGVPARHSAARASRAAVGCVSPRSPRLLLASTDSTSAVAHLRIRRRPVQPEPVQRDASDLAGQCRQRGAHLVDVVAVAHEGAHGRQGGHRR